MRFGTCVKSGGSKAEGTLDWNAVRLSIEKPLELVSSGISGTVLVVSGLSGTVGSNSTGPIPA